MCEDELLAIPEAKLLEKEGSGCEALLRDNKTDDLSRMCVRRPPAPNHTGVKPLPSRQQRKRMGLRDCARAHGATYGWGPHLSPRAALP